MIWKNAIDEVATFLDKGKIPCILLENKFDLLENEKKDDPELIDFASKNKFDGVFRTSAKTGLNIDESIKFLILNIFKRYENMHVKILTKQNIRWDLKIIVVGNSATGKSNIVTKWTENIFRDTYKQTLVSEFGSKIFENEGNFYRIQLWALPGQDINQMVTKVHVKDAHGCIIVSDTNNFKTREE